MPTYSEPELLVDRPDDEWFQTKQWLVHNRFTFPTFFILENRDGTLATTIGTGFTYNANGQVTGGTITELTRTDSANTIEFGEITGLSLQANLFRTRFHARYRATIDLDRTLITKLGN